MVLNKILAVAVIAATGTTALAGEPGGFRPGLYAGEVGGALFASTPSIGASLLVLIPATASD